MEPINLYTTFCLLNWSHKRCSAIWASLIWYCVRQVWLVKRRRNRMWKFVGNQLTASAYASVFVVTWSSRDHQLIVWTNQSLADVLRLSTCDNVNHVHVDDQHGWAWHWHMRMAMIAATGRCRCLQIWVWEFAIQRQSQWQHSWRSCPLHSYGLVVFYWAASWLTRRKWLKGF